MLGIIELPAAESAVGPHNDLLLIALVLQDISQHRGVLIKMLLGVHPVEAALIGQEGAVKRHLQGQAAGLGQHAGYGIAGLVEDKTAVELLITAGKILILHRQFRQLGNVIVLKAAAMFEIRKGILHGFQENIDQIPFLFRKFHGSFRRIRVILFNKGIIRGLVPDECTHAQPVPGNPAFHRDRRRGYQGDRLFQSEKGLFPLIPYRVKNADGQQYHRRQQAGQQKSLNDAAPRSLDWSRQMIDGLFNVQFGPGLISPAGGQSQKDRQHQQQDRKHRSDDPCLCHLFPLTASVPPSVPAFRGSFRSVMPVRSSLFFCFFRSRRCFCPLYSLFILVFCVSRHSFSF